MREKLSYLEKLYQNDKERIKNFELKVQNKSIFIFDILHQIADRKRRKPNHRFIYSYFDVEVNLKRRIPSGTRYMDAYDVNDFKERLSKLFTEALKIRLPEQIIPKKFPNEISAIINIRKRFIHEDEYFHRALLYNPREEYEDIKGFFFRPYAWLRHARHYSYESNKINIARRYSYEGNKIKYCRVCGAVGDDIRKNSPPGIILDNDLSYPKYICKRCGFDWGLAL